MRLKLQLKAVVFQGVQMLKQSANQKLPTFLQWCKENDAFDDDCEFGISRVLWGDEWKTITFVTESFRYSIKLNSETQYSTACSEILDAFQPKKVLCVKLVYEGKTREMDVIIREANELDEGFCATGDQQEWGITFKHCKAPAQKPEPARQQKRSAKQKTEQPPF